MSPARKANCLPGMSMAYPTKSLIGPTVGVSEAHALVLNGSLYALARGSRPV